MIDLLTGEWIVKRTSAKARRVFNYWLTIFWIVLVPISFLTGWASRVAFVTLLSLVALILANFGAWAAETPVETEIAEGVEELTNQPQDDKL